MTHIALLLMLTAGALPFGSTAGSGGEAPWRVAGLSDREAAAHVLDRLTFGARPGDVDRVLEMGIDRWIDAQIEGSFEETALDARLRDLDALNLTAREMIETFPPPGVLQRRLGREKTAAVQEAMAGDDAAAKRRARADLMSAMREEGLRPLRELLGQTMAQKVLRAVLAENQLHEVLVDFWFNHFNVAVTDNQARPWILSYERDAIRPHVVSDFRDLLGATAEHPAMLYYLDNAASRAAPGVETELDHTRESLRAGRPGGRGRGARGGFGGGPRAFGAGGDLARARPDGGGLNENYARELMELHTLGVDGGYTQEDVVEVARAFTGWTVRPPFAARGAGGTAGRRPANPFESDDPRVRQFAQRAGFVIEDDFVFHPGFHDAGPKSVLGKPVRARGVDEGRRVLDRLAAHPSTARHLATKLAIRFVSDQPPAAVVDRLADRYLKSDGDLAAVLEELFASPEFWASRGEKLKSPLELAVSAVRATGSVVRNPRGLVDWISKMGQPLYAYQAPTGYPDQADFWVSSGSLLNRMSFGLALAEGRVPGTSTRLERLPTEDAGAAGPEAMEPASRREALASWGALLLPERDLEETLDLLEPMASQPDVATRVDEAIAEPGSGSSAGSLEPLLGAPAAEEATLDDSGREESLDRLSSAGARSLVGLLLGSPEFQRH